MQQQTTNPKETTLRHKPLTPVEKLLADKIDIERKCRAQKKKLSEDFAYIQDNASGLLLSGISSLLFPPRNSVPKGEKQVVLSGNETHDATKNSPTSLSDYLTIGKSLLPVVWEIAQPLLFTWGISKAKSLLFGLFAKKKR